MALSDYLDVIRGAGQIYTGYQSGNYGGMAGGISTVLTGQSGGLAGIGTPAGSGNSPTNAGGSGGANRDIPTTPPPAVADIREPIVIMGAFLLSAVGLLIAAGGSK